MDGRQQPSPGKCHLGSLMCASTHVAFIGLVAYLFADSALKDDKTPGYSLGIRERSTRVLYPSRRRLYRRSERTNGPFFPVSLKFFLTSNLNGHFRDHLRVFPCTLMSSTQFTQSNSDRFTRLGTWIGCPVGPLSDPRVVLEGLKCTCGVHIIRIQPLHELTRVCVLWEMTVVAGTSAEFARSREDEGSHRTLKDCVGSDSGATVLSSLPTLLTRPQLGTVCRRVGGWSNRNVMAIVPREPGTQSCVAPPARCGYESLCCLRYKCTGAFYGLSRSAR